MFQTHHLSWDAAGILRQATGQEIIKIGRKDIGYEVRGLDLSDSRLKSWRVLVIMVMSQLSS